MGACTSQHNRSVSNTNRYERLREPFHSKFEDDTLVNYQYNKEWKKAMIVQKTSDTIALDVEISAFEYERLVVDIETAMNLFGEHKLLKIETKIPAIFTTFNHSKMVQLDRGTEEWYDAEMIGIDVENNAIQLQFDDGSVQRMSRCKMIIDFLINRTVRFPSVIYPRWVKVNDYVTLMELKQHTRHPSTQCTTYCRIESVVLSSPLLNDGYIQLKRFRTSVQSPYATDAVYIYATEIRKIDGRFIETLDYLLWSVATKVMKPLAMHWHFPSVVSSSKKYSLCAGFIRIHCRRSTVVAGVILSIVMRYYEHSDADAKQLLRKMNQANTKGASIETCFITPVKLMFGFAWFLKICPKEKAKRYSSLNRTDFVVRLCMIPIGHTFSSLELRCVIDSTFGTITKEHKVEYVADTIVELPCSFWRHDVNSNNHEEQWTFDVSLLIRNIKDLDGESVEVGGKQFMAHHCLYPLQVPYEEHDWHIGAKEMQQVRDKTFGEDMGSEIFSLRSLEWRFVLYPNGVSLERSEGDAEVFLQLVTPIDGNTKIWIQQQLLLDDNDHGNDDKQLVSVVCFRTDALMHGFGNWVCKFDKLKDQAGFDVIMRITVIDQSTSLIIS